MNAIEDRLRAAARAAADTVPADAAPPLRLRVRRGQRLVLPGPWRRAVVPRVMAPVAAAAMVVAVVTASAVLAGGTPRASTGDAPRPGPARTGVAAAPSTTPPLSPADQAALASVPPYYAALSGSSAYPHYAGGLLNDLVIRATASGTVLATVKPPAPYGTFSWVTAASDDRTFVVAAQPFVDTGSGVDSNDEPTAFFLLRFSPASRAARLTPLPIPQEPASRPVSGIALSPDATKLAVAVSPWSTTPQDRQLQPRNPEIQVLTLATGAEKEWTYQGPGWIGLSKPLGQPLSWAADSRTLAFEQEAGSDGQNVSIRLLDTATAGGSLLQSSKLAGSSPDGVPCGENVFLTAAATRIVCAGYRPYSKYTDDSIDEFSVSTGMVVSTLGTLSQVAGAIQGYVGGVLWVSPSGSQVILVGGILTGDHLTPLPGIAQDPYELAW